MATSSQEVKADLGPPALKRSKILPKEVTASLRKEYVSPSLSLHYSESQDGALKILYGKGAYLYDENDQPYLDCINNVTQVGHCNEKVVEAFASQSSATGFGVPVNSDLLKSYTSHLLSHFPAEFGYVFFVNSGTEANDLALHIAEVVTGHTEVIAIEGAYHGHSKHLLGLSSYKLNQQSGEHSQLRVNTRAWLAPLPDSFRGKHRGSSTGTLYADDVKALITKANSQGKQIASFIGEAFLGCAGQIELPEGYLEATFKHVRSAGGLCIIDEVQTGFGRAGDHFWLFESQGVVPDMVTVGKPMGNGHPVSAVVTTEEIAKKYIESIGESRAPSYWSDPVSLAVADAVLTVIETQHMQNNAKVLGDHIQETVKEMMTRHKCIGDIRGFGLFIGVEIVKDQDGREADGDLCVQIVHRVLQEHKIMIKDDGLEHNVIKIKPPLCFTRSDADKLLTAMDSVMTSLGV